MCYSQGMCRMCCSRLRMSKILQTPVPNYSYTERAKIISSTFRTRPTTPIETSVWWIQYVISNGELSKSHATDLSWFVYYSVDVMLFLASIIVCSVYGTFVLFRTSMNRIRKRCTDYSKKIE